MAETLCSTAILFLLYRIVVIKLGLEALGIWSLVLATTSLMRLADAGTASGLVRFIATAREEERKSTARDYIDTAILTNLALYVLLALAFYLPAKQGIPLAIRTPAAALEAQGLLPYALASFVLGNIAATTNSTLVGLHRSDLKSAVIIGGLLIQAMSSVVLIPQFGLAGLAQAQILQSCFCIITNLIIAKYILYKTVGVLVPHRWNWHSFKELVRFGSQLQAAGLIVFLYDPISKFLMSMFGGLEAAGLFEVANRLVFQTRAIVISPIQSLVPAFASAKVNAPDRVAGLYTSSMGVTMTLGIPAFALLTLASPLASLALIGNINELFILFVALLAFGWLANLLSVPAYFMGIGVGQLRWNILGNSLITATCGSTGLVLGWTFGAIGVGCAAALAQAIGALVIIVMNCRDQQVRRLPGPVAAWRTLLIRLNPPISMSERSTKP
ncbi:oligosaccharide flippase family protein [Bradyrhizobium sp. CCGE-LA001]|uniref:oligosaccharide flippase family protein n=1 Tax=Bradyrhizobium sp. CCGE-LA001 TaxID=1223566 RepID=UPI0013144AC1|nr:oligosaccharide flippase family protein [Bradyrhizobium sp. CCGE-LA001]